MRAVDSLRKVNTMSPWQLAVVLVMTGIGSGMVTAANNMFSTAGQVSWLIPLISGWAYFGIAYLMIKMGDMFPQEPFSLYLQRIWGRPVALLLIWALLITILARLSIGLQSFAHEIIFFIFDRTPMEVIIITLLGVAAYCALQDLGTVLKVIQLLFSMFLPILVGIILLGFINFQFINIYPLGPLDLGAIVKASQEFWVYYTGYEFLLWLLPWVYRGKSSVTKAVGAAFAVKGLLISIVMLMVLGTQTLEGVRGTPYPVAISIRSVELPGTFVERVDNYLYFAWIPLAFITHALPLFIIANIIAEMYGYKDHRPFVLMLVPVLFFGGMSFHDLAIFNDVSRIIHWPGLVFSFIIIPASYFLAYRKKTMQKTEKL